MENSMPSMSSVVIGDGSPGEDYGASPDRPNGVEPVKLPSRPVSPLEEAADAPIPQPAMAPTLDTSQVAMPPTSPMASPRSPSYAPTKTTVVNLTSISATSSAFPEPFGLNISPKGRWIVAYSSGALYFLQSSDLPDFKHSCRSFRLRRKPVAVAITDIGRFAVLSGPHKVDVFQCEGETGASFSGAVKKLGTFVLNNDTRTLAFSINGEMVATGSDQGIELCSVGLVAGMNRRQINCGSVDSLSFSEDGKSLLVTGAARRNRTSTYITINGSFEQALFEEEEAEQQPIGKLWISQLLFPERLLARQSAFLPDPSDGQASELLSYDPKAERFGVFDAALKQFNGKTLEPPEDFRLSRSERYDDALPTVSANGSYVALAVKLKNRGEVWTYRVPAGWRDEPPSSSPNDEQTCHSMSLAPVQRLCLPKDDNAPSEIVASLRWLQVPDAPVERLIALVSTVGLSMPEDVVPTVGPAAGGKVVLFDFRRSGLSPSDRTSGRVTVDLDECSPSEDLADEELELDREVDIVRRRTQVQRRTDSTRVSSPRDSIRLRRSLSSSSRNGPTSPNEPNGTRPRRRRSFSSISDMGEEPEIPAGPAVAIDEPYSNSAPRSQFSLNRAATVAANSLAARTHLRSLPTRPLEYRRADGLREMPHESDADDWVPPPPPYTAKPDPPGPNAISLPITAMPAVAAALIAQSGQPGPNRSVYSNGRHVLSGQAPHQPRVLQRPTRGGQSRRLSRRTRQDNNNANTSIAHPPVTSQPRHPNSVPAAQAAQRPPRSMGPPNPAPAIQPQPLVPAIQAAPPVPMLQVPPAPAEQQASQVQAPSPAPISTPMPQSQPPPEPQQASQPAPAPGVLHSPRTFPLTTPPRASPQNSSSYLQPRLNIASSQLSVSAPVSPINPLDQSTQGPSLASVLSPSSPRPLGPISDSPPVIPLPAGLRSVQRPLTPEQQHNRLPSSILSLNPASLSPDAVQTTASVAASRTFPRTTSRPISQRPLSSAELNRPLPSLPPPGALTPPSSAGGPSTALSSSMPRHSGSGDDSDPQRSRQMPKRRPVGARNATLPLQGHQAHSSVGIPMPRSVTASPIGLGPVQGPASGAEGWQRGYSYQQQLAVHLPSQQYVYHGSANGNGNVSGQPRQVSGGTRPGSAWGRREEGSGGFRCVVM